MGVIKCTKFDRAYYESDVEATFDAFYETMIYEVNKYFEIKKVIFNDPATIVLWKNGEKTVVKVQGDDEYDPEKGMAMAIAKHFMGDNYHYYDIFKKWVPYEAVKVEKDETIDLYGDGTRFAVVTPIKNPGPVKDYFDMGNVRDGCLSNGKYSKIAVSFFIKGNDRINEAYFLIPSGDKNELNESFNAYAKSRYHLQNKSLVVTDIIILRTGDTIFDVE